jgi:hypothetical protein
MNLPHRFENAEAIRKIYLIGMLFDQVVHYHVMGGTTDNTHIVMLRKLNDFLVIGDILGRLPGIPETGQTVGSDAGNNGRHG